MRKTITQVSFSRSPASFLSMLLLALIVALQGCGSAKSSAMDSPEATFATLKDAIADRNLETYGACWHPGRIEREGMLSQLKEKPERWDELDALFKGETSIAETKMFEQDGNRMCKLQVKAPEADRGGIGTMTMIKVDDNWLMWSW